MEHRGIISKFSGLILVLLCVSAWGQNTKIVVDRLEVKQSMKLVDKTVTSITTDSTLSAATHAQLATSQAVKKYIDGLTSGLSTTYFPLVGGTITGTSGNGFVGLIPQSSAPSSPGSGVRVYADASGNLSWRGTADVFTRGIDGVLTANRVYTAPNGSGTWALLEIAQTWTAAQTFTMPGASGAGFMVSSTTQSSKPWPVMTDAQAAALTGQGTGNAVFSSTQNRPFVHNGTAFQGVVLGPQAGISTDRIPYGGTNGNLNSTANFTFNSSGNVTNFSNGMALHIAQGAYTNTVTASSGTVGTAASFNLPSNAILSTNTSVTYTNAATLQIVGAPTAGTNSTITNPLAIMVASGNSHFPQIRVSNQTVYANIGGTNADTYGPTAKGFFTTGQISGSGAAIVAGSNVNGNNTTGFGLISAIRSSSSGVTNTNGYAILAELSMNPNNTSGQWVHYTARGQISASTTSVNSVGYELVVTPNVSFVDGYVGGSYLAFTGQILSRSKQGFQTVRGYNWSGLGGVASSGNTTITNYNPLAIAAGNLTEVTNTWSYIDHKLAIGSSSNVHSSALLELTSTTLGFRPPVMTDAQIAAISSPATGLQAFSSTDDRLNVRLTSAWAKVAYTTDAKRDTTIYFEDVDYNFAAAVTSANILSRYNRIFIYGRTTSSASSDSQLLLHNASANFLQTQIFYYSIDENGTYDNTVDFNSNLAIDGAGGTVGSYPLVAGQQVTIQTVDRGGYKWAFN